MKSVINCDGAQLAVVIPHEVAAQANLYVGSEVEVTAELGKIVIRSAGSPHYSLADLGAQITDENPRQWA